MANLFERLTGTTTPVSSGLPLAGTTSSTTGTMLERLTSNAPTPSSISPGTATEQPAVHPSVGGWFHNWVSGFQNIAKGITGIVGAVGHDAIETIDKIVPGQQSLENDPYQTAAIVKALPMAVISDYRNRYGGLSNIVRGLYENPLAYLSDALIAAGGVGAAAEVGRGTEFFAETASKVPLMARLTADLPAIVPEDLARTILGPGKMTIGAADVAQKTLSYNPLTRALQKSYWGTLEHVSPGYVEARAATLLKGEIKAGMAGTASDIEAQTRDIWNPVRAVAKDTGVKFDELKTATGDQAVDFLHGEPPPVGAPSGTLSPFTSPVDTPTIPQVSQIIEGDADKVLKPLASTFKDSIWKKRWEGGVAKSLSSDAGALKVGDELSFKVQVADMNQAPRVLDDAARALNARVEGALNTFADGTVENKYIGAIRLADGRVLHLSVATPSLDLSQRLIKWIQDTTAPLRAALETKMAGPEYPTKVQDIADLENEIQAADVTMRQLAYHPLRQMNDLLTADHPLRIPYAGSSLEVADRYRLFHFNNATMRWLQDGGHTYTDVMNEAYRTMRMTNFAKQLEDWANPLHDIIQNLAPQDAYNQIMAFLQGKGLTAKKAAEVLGAPWETGTPAVEELMTMLRNGLRPTFLEGKDGFPPGFSWQDLHTGAGDENIPSQFPKMIPDPPSVYLQRGGKLTPSTVQIAQEPFKKFLEDEGPYLRDPMKVFQKIALRSQLSKQTIQGVEHIMQKTGYIVPVDEVANWTPKAGMVLASPQLFEHYANISDEVLQETYHLMPQYGYNYDQAITKAFENMQLDINKSAVNVIGTGEVWAIPKVVADKLMAQTNRSLGWTAQLFWDTPMKMWKASVLSLSPRWLLNHFMGGMVFAGIDNPAGIKSMFAQWSAKNRTLAALMLGPEGIKEITGAGGEFTKSLFTKPYEEQSFADRIQAFVGGKEGQYRAYTQPFRGVSFMMRRMGQTMVDAQRTGLTISALDKEYLYTRAKWFSSTVDKLEHILRDGYTPEQLQSAVNDVTKTLGDFVGYGPREAAFRRFFMPFYGFYRHTVGMLLRLPFEHPYKAAILAQLNRVDEVMQPLLPGWLHGAAKVGQLGGMDTYFRFMQYNPFAVASGEKEQMIGTLGPVPQMAIERMLGINTFTGQPFQVDNPNFIRLENGDLYQVNRAGDGSVLGVQPLDEGTHFLPPIWQQLANDFPQFQMIPGIQFATNKPLFLQLLTSLGIPVSQFDTNSFAMQQMIAKRQALAKALKP